MDWNNFSLIVWVAEARNVEREEEAAGQEDMHESLLTHNTDARTHATGRKK